MKKADTVKLVYLPEEGVAVLTNGKRDIVLYYSPIKDAFFYPRRTVVYPSTVYSVIFGQDFDAEKVIQFTSEKKDIKGRGQQLLPFPINPKDLKVEIKNRKISQTVAKEEFKAYETPSSFMRGVFSLVKDIIELNLTKRELEKGQVNDLVVVDFQAGSGVHAKASKEAGLRIKLLGSEIREGENDENNLVFYKTDWEIFKKAYHTAFNARAKEETLFYLNPPYTVGGEIERKTYDAIPEGSVVVGLFSTKVKNYIKNNIDGLIFEVPKEITGYQDEKAPEKFIFVIGRKERFAGKGYEVGIAQKATPEAFFNGLKKKLKEVSQKKELQSTFERKLKQITSYFSPVAGLYSGRRIEKLSGLYPRLKSEVIFLKKKYEMTPEKLKSLFEEFLDRNSFRKELIRGKRIFPDLRFFNTQVFLTIDEVLLDRDYLRFLKEIYPELFEDVKKVATEMNRELPKEVLKEEGKTYLTNERIGIMEMAFWPRKIPYDEKVEKVLKEFANEEEKEVLSRLSGEINSLVVKMKVGSTQIGFENSFGYTATLVAVNEKGRELFSFSLPLRSFYQKLKEVGAVEFKKWEVIKPEKEFKKKLIEALIENQKDFLKSLSLTPNRWQEIFKKFLSYSKEGRARALIRIIKENPDIVEKFKKISINRFPFESFLDLKVKEYLSSASKKELYPYLKDVVRKVAEEYNRAPKAFFERKDKENFIKELLSAYPPSVKEDLKTTILETVAEHYFFVSTTRQSFLRAFSFLEKTERMKALMKKGDVEKAYELFEALFLKDFSLMPHQFNEAVNFLAKWDKTKEGGHLLGWEMRSGKSLTFLTIAYLSSLLLKKNSLVFPKTANVSDIYYQALVHIPSILPYLKVYTETETVPSFKTGKLPFKSTYPNLLRIVSMKRSSLLRKVISGTKAEELLLTYTREMEELIEVSREKLKENSLEELVKDKRFKDLTQLRGYEDEVKLAVYYYLKRHEKDFNFEDEKATKEYINALLSHGEKMEVLKEKTPQVNAPFSISLVPKTAVIAYNYKIPVSEVVLSKEKNISVKALYDYEIVGKEFFFGELGAEDFKERKTAKFVRVFKDGDERGFVVRADLLEKLENKGLIEESTLVADVNGGNTLYAVKLKEGREEDFLNFLKEEEEQEEVATLEDFKSAVFLNMTKTANNLDYLLKKWGLIRENLTSLRLYGDFLGFVSYEEIDGILYPVVYKIGKRQIDPNDPEKDLVSPVWAKGEVELIAPSLKSIPTVSFVLREGANESVRKPFLTSNANALDYFVHSDSFNELGAVIVDEADEATNPTSNNYRALFYLGKQSEVKVAATGTPTSGYPETVYALLGLVSDLKYEEIVYGMSFIKDKFSSYSVKFNQKAGVPFFFFYIWSKHGEFFNSLFDKVKDILKSEQNSKRFAVRFLEELSYIAERVEDPYLKKFVREAQKFPAVDISRNLKRFVSSISKLEKEYSLRVNRDNFVELAFQALKGSLKREAGTFNPFGYVSSLFVKGASLSLNTRSYLKGRSEVLEFDDDVVELIDEELKTKGKIEVFGVNPFSPNSVLLRNFYDIGLSKDIGENNYHIISDVVVSNFELYLKELKKAKNLNTFLNYYNVPFTPKEFKRLLEKETTSRNDDAVSILKTFFVNNFDLEKTAKELSISEEKVRAFTLVWKDFSDFLRNYHHYLAEYQSKLQKLKEKKGKIKKDLEDLALVEATVPSGIAFKPILSDLALGNGETATLEVGEVNGLPVLIGKDGFPLEFSTEVVFSRQEWETLGNIAIPYRLKKLTPEEHEIIDAFSNLGHYERIKHLIEQGKSFLLSSSRVLPLTFSFLDALSFLKEGKEKGIIPKDKEVHLLVRVSDKRVKDVIDKLPLAQLEEIGIFLKTFRDNNLLDAESKKLKKRMKREDVQLLVVSTDETIARGVDLSHLDEIVYVSPSKSGKTATQLFARLFNAKDKDYGSITIFGKPLAFSEDKRGNKMNGKGEKRIVASGTFYKSYDLLEKFSFIRKIMTGELVNFYSGVGLKLTELGKSLLTKSELEKELEDVLTFGT